MKRLFRHSYHLLAPAVLLGALAAGPALADDELELVLQAGHQEPVTNTVWLDDRRLISGSSDGSIKIWDTATQKVKRTMWAPNNLDDVQGVDELLVTPEGLWAGYGKGRMILWDVETGTVKKSFQLPDDIYWYDYEVQRDSMGRLYAWDDGYLRILDSDGKLLEKFDFEHTPDTFRISADGSIWVYSFSDGVRVRSDKKETLIPETFASHWGVVDLILDPSGKRVYVSTAPGWLEGWEIGADRPFFQEALVGNPHTKEQLSGPAYGGEDVSCVFSSYDESHFLATERNSGRVFKVEFATGKWELMGSIEANFLTDVAFNQSKTSIMAASIHDNKVPLGTKTGNGFTVAKMGGEADFFSTIATAKNKLLLASGTAGIVSFDMASGSPFRNFPSGYFPALATDRDKLFCGGNDGLTYCYDVDSGKELWSRDLTNEGARYGYGPTGIAVNPAASQIAVAVFETRPRILLMDSSTGKTETEIPNQSADALLYSGDGRQLFFSHQREVSLYDLNYRKVLHSWKLPGSQSKQVVGLVNHPTEDSVMALDRDGSLFKFARNRLDVPAEKVADLDIGEPSDMSLCEAGLLICSGTKVYLCSTEGKVLHTYRGHVSYTADAALVNGTLVTTGADSMVGLWDPKNERNRAKLYTLREGTDWLVTTPDFKFDGNQGAQDQLEWRWNGQLYQVSRFFEKFYEPGLLARILNGQRAATAEQTAAPTVSLGSKPPVVSIQKPKSLGQDEYEVSLQIEGDHAGWDDVRLYHNGHRVPGQNPYRFKAVTGKNTLRASALNTEKTVESEPDKLTFEVDAPGQKSTLYIFAAAVNDYPNPLDFAVPDAKSFSEAFKPGLYDKVEKTVLFDKDADKQSILDKLKAIPCQPQDTLLVFLAGHGTIIDNRFHYLPYGSNGSEASKALSSQELGKVLAQLPATRQVLFLDTCHAGASAKDLAELLVERGAPLRSSAQGAQFIKDQQLLARQAGTFLVAGSTPNATAAEVPQLGHGIFTYAVLNGLKSETGDDKTITVNQLLTYLNEKVPELSQKFRGSPLGIWQFSAGQDFPIAKP